MTTFYLIRHAQKADDISSDPGLSALGRAQAHATAAYLKTRSINARLYQPLASCE